MNIILGFVVLMELSSNYIPDDSYFECTGCRIMYEWHLSFYDRNKGSLYATFLKDKK